MIETFYEWFEGKFNNRIQAFTYPSRYAYIVVEHRKVNNHGLFYGEQAYFNKTLKPYRQFILQITESHDNIIVRNYEVKDKSLHLGFKNLNLISGNALTYKPGCDTIFTYHGDHFEGHIEEGCNCLVKWGEKDSYLKNSAYIGDGWYNVEDKGFDPETHTQLWGSKFGHFEFKKIA
ncbi:antenna proteins [Synechococcus phage S-PM2]|uniref:Antenna proteins n=1 Tax=Synechococcus phage S-PM2 TaxID=238854 RepID=Q5GQC2_BPSYP|nr:CpeT-like antenna protein [Synechococcus phage S-PM2]CAF34280.1 antenna proteins [Synechococcus phage S-PM2]CFW42447.1 antenna proteins [Synechococcus phage S-PM2]